MRATVGRARLGPHGRAFLCEHTTRLCALNLTHRDPVGALYDGLRPSCALSCSDLMHASKACEKPEATMEAVRFDPAIMAVTLRGWG